jgi:ketosteroid isomerase-like protein
MPRLAGMGEAEVARLHEIYADWTRGDYSRTDLLHPDFQLEFAEDFLDDGVFEGIEAAGRGWEQWTSQWASWRTTPGRFIDLGDRLLVLIRVNGIAKASGMELSQASANLWEFRDGLPSRLVIYAHEARALRDHGIESA